MKVLEITYPKDDYIDISLSKGVMNDFLYEQIFFTINIEDVNVLDFLYRSMYEGIYLRQSKHSLYDINRSMITLKISVSEAINFVKSACPPIFKHREYELYNSLESLKESLSTFIEGRTNQYDYISLFKKCIGLNYFETTSSYNVARSDLLRPMCGKNPLIDIIVSKVPIHDLYDENHNKPNKMHFMYNCLRKSDLMYLCEMISEFVDKGVFWKILNISYVEFKGYFVEIFVDNYYHCNCNKTRELFIDTYNKL